jgi:hypothetical protein
MHSARANEVASTLASPLAERFVRGDLEDEHLREPSEFLLRVLKTFTDSPAAQPSVPFAAPPPDGALRGRGIS